MARDRLRSRSVAAGLVTFFFSLFALIGARSGMPRSPRPLVKIPLGSPANIDGVVKPGEWRGAADVAIYVEPGWTVKVLRQPLPSIHRVRSEEHTSELQSLAYLVCRLLLEKKKLE